jgi:thiol-disulfide isomerase/thioredoxin
MKNRLPQYILIVTVAAFASLAVYYSFFSAAPEPESASEATAESRPGTSPTQSLYLQMTDLQGSPVRMDSTKLLFVNVWATWCGPCNVEMPSIQTLYDKYRDHPQMAFYIVSDENPAKVIPFIERKGYRLPFYQFTGDYPAELNGDAIPRTYLIRNGQVLAQEIGANQWDDPRVIAFIEQQLQAGQ